MRGYRIALFLLALNATGILHAQDVAAAAPRHAQKAADPSQRYFRLICLVHLTGSGANGEAVTPEYVADGVEAAKRAPTISVPQDPTKDRPAPVAAFSVARPGIIAWSMQPTDDKQMAILYLVAAEHSAFDAILNDKRAEIRVFEIGKDKREDIERELSQYKKGFTLDSFRVVAQ